MKRIACMLIISGLAPAISSAEGLDRNDEVSFRFGGYGSGGKIKIDNEDDIGKGGGAFGFRYVHNMSPRIGLGIEMNALDAGEHESAALVNNAISATKLKTTDILAVARLRFGSGQFRPYVLGGVGMNSTSLRLASRPQAGLVWLNTGTSETRTLIDSRKTGSALALETGFDYHFNAVVSAGAFLGWHYQTKATYDATGAGRALGLSGAAGSFAGVMLGGSLSARF